MKKFLVLMLIGMAIFLAPSVHATVSDTYEPELLTGDGNDKDFDFDFKVFSASDLIVAIVDPVTLVATEQSLGSDYSVTIGTSVAGGTVTFTNAPGDGKLVSIRRDIPVTQTTDIPSGGLFREVQIENALDKQTLVSQQLSEAISRALLQSPYTTTIDVTFPAPVSNKVIGWNAAGTQLENKVAIDANVAAAAAASASAASGSASAASGSAIAAAASASSVPTILTGTFTNSTLAGGVLTVTHSKALSAPYTVTVTIYDNTGKVILPDNITGAANSVAIDLTSFGVLSGTWGYRVQ